MNINRININKCGDIVKVRGWIIKYKKLGKISFGFIEDYTGKIQFIIKDLSIINKNKNILSNSIVKIVGKVCEKVNPAIHKKNYSCEILVKEFHIISKSSLLPVDYNDYKNTNEKKYYQYRYLFLRNQRIQNNIILRAKANKYIRDYLCSKKFYEIETPILSSPNFEGSKEFIVPYKTDNLSFYSLSQSPQIYKQLLMCSHFNKYFQIVKCFRDEKSRSNRQPEFSQLDIEYAYCNYKSIKSLISTLLRRLIINVFKINDKTSFTSIEYFNAIKNYGSDSPDLRFKNELNYYKNKNDNTESIYLLFRNANYKINNYKFIYDIQNKYKNSKCYIFDNLSSVENYNMDFYKHLKNTHGKIKKNCLIIILCGENKRLNFCAGKIRDFLGKELKLYDDSLLSFVWIEKWPLFKLAVDNKTIVPSHHPFCLPASKSFLSKKIIKNESLLKIMSHAYDIALNGDEIGGGTLRINDSNMQRKIFSLLGMDDTQIDNNFGYFLEALSYGTPPHGGIALGLDRIYAKILGINNIRDIILFPKLTNGNDSLNSRKKFGNELKYLKRLLNEK